MIMSLKNICSIGRFMMTGWSFFFTLMGVATLAAQVFRVVDYIERPARHPRRSAAR